MGWWWRKRNKKLILERGAQLLKDLIELGHGKSNPIKFFSADEIRKATNYFSHSNLVYMVEFFDWYSGKNENHPMILIKKCVRFYSLGVDPLCRDIAVSSMVSGHKSFLKLVGCCLELEKPVMVYHDVKKHYKLDISKQTWKRRMKIAEDIATALAYLHTAFPRPVIYRFLSLWNISKGCVWLKVPSWGRRLLCRDIAVSSMVSGHKNFLKLIGCCLEFEHLVMVYHGVKKHYQLEIREQPWKRRMKIAEDIATAFAYLHTAFPRPFVYRSFSLNNILLDEDGVAKLTDFSFCVSIPEGETFVQVDRITGTYGHMDTNYAMNCVVSEKTDVFAFGILLQKFLMGENRFWYLQNDVVFEKTDDNEEDGEGDDDDNSYASAAMSEINDQRRQFSEEAYGEGDDDDDDSATMWRTDKRLLFRLLKFKEEHRMDEIVDSVILQKMGEISEHELCQMNAFWMLSLRCMGYKGEVPTMVEVAKELKKIQTSLINDSSSPSGETHFDSPQDISSSVVLSNQT